SVFGTTGFGRSPKVCACGIFGFGRLIASGGMVGIVIPLVVLQIRRADERFLTPGAVAFAVLGAFRRQHLRARKDLPHGATNPYEQWERLRFHHHRFGRGRRNFGVPPRSEWQENSTARARAICSARERELEFLGGECARPLQHERTLAQRRRQRATSTHQLLRRWQHQVLWRSAVPSPRRGFWRDKTFRWDLTGLAHLVQRAGAV